MSLSRDRAEEVLAHIDSLVGPPDKETEKEREERRKMVIRDAEARRIRKTAS